MKKTSIKKREPKQPTVGLKLKLEGKICGYIADGPFKNENVLEISQVEGIIIVKLGNNTFKPTAQEIVDCRKFVKKHINPLFEVKTLVAKVGD